MVVCQIYIIFAGELLNKTVDMKIKVTKVIRLFAARVFVTLVLFAAPVMMLWAQEMNKKFSMTTEIFLNEQNEKKGQSEGEKGSTTEHYLSDGTVIKPRKLVADPITIDGVTLVSSGRSTSRRPNE